LPGGSLDAALHGLMMHPKQSSHGKEGRAISIGQKHARPLDPACRSVRGRAIAISFVTSSSSMVNSTTSRGAAMMQGLVQRIVKRS
jgi:hypothetical protein